MIKVFIVENEIEIRESIHKMIPWEKYDFECVGEAEDGEKAWVMIQELRPDLVITDIEMPFMDGLTLSKQIKEKLPGTKIIIISEDKDFAYTSKAIALGVDRYLLKPVQQEELLEVLEDMQGKIEVAVTIEKERKKTIHYAQQLDIEAVDPVLIKDFLCNAHQDEVESFVEKYVKKIGESAFQSVIFRQYILLNIHFSTVSFIQKLGYERDKISEHLDQICNPLELDEEKVKEVIANILRQGIKLRDENAKGRTQSIIGKAIQFMENNYQDDHMSLKSVASLTNVSANHFSYLFSQEMGQTFIEYLTNIRMKRAKELLRCTDMRSGEIAYEVGYRDSHYFSSLFKKTQGCTPSEYRNGKEK